MAEPEYVVVYTATYPTVAAAQEALNTIEHLPKHEVGGKFDAAVIDKVDGQPHVAKRLEYPPRRIIPERFGERILTRKELDDAAGELAAGAAGLIVIGEATIEPALDKVFAGTKVGQREILATVDQITSELEEAFKA
jgi:hypothetical protein